MSPNEVSDDEEVLRGGGTRMRAIFDPEIRLSSTGTSGAVASSAVGPSMCPNHPGPLRLATCRELGGPLEPKEHGTPGSVYL